MLLNQIVVLLHGPDINYKIPYGSTSRLPRYCKGEVKEIVLDSSSWNIDIKDLR